LPHIASVIHRESLALEELGEAAPLPRIRLASVLIGNGLSDPRIQFGQGVVEFMCNSPQAVFDPAGPECANLASKAATCARLIESCYKTGSRFACTPAGLYCWSNLYGDFQKLGLVRADSPTLRRCDGPVFTPKLTPARTCPAAEPLRRSEEGASHERTSATLLD
jgi:cathepsin A (carboxypeptidase C)